MTKGERTLKSSVVFRGPFFLLREHSVRGEQGREATRIVLEHPGAACAVPILADGRLVLVRQYRKAVEEFTLEFPAGKLESNESPEQCLERELVEEIGYRPGSLEKLGSFHPAFGYSNEIIHLFVARLLEPVPRRGGDELYLEPCLFGFAEILRMIDDGRIRDGKTVIAALQLARLRAEGGTALPGANGHTGSG